MNNEKREPPDCGISIAIDGIYVRRLDQNDGRDPVTCGSSIAFDGIYVCRLCLLPCTRVRQCPQKTVFKTTCEGYSEELMKE